MRGDLAEKKCERVNYMASPILAGKRTTRQDKPIAGWLPGCDEPEPELWMQCELKSKLGIGSREPEGGPAECAQ